MRFRLSKGLDLPLAGAPAQEIGDGPAVASVGVLAEDYRGIAPSLAVGEGDRVRCGQVLFRDRRAPAIACTSPGAGVVEAVHVGARRALRAIVIRLGGDDAVEHPAVPREALPRLDPPRARDLLLERGLWLALRSRPYGVVPRPDATPDAIFVTAIDTNPLAADPRVIVAAHRDAFADGLVVLARLAAAPVFLCVAPGADLPVRDPERVRVAEFAGPHPAGLPGTHIHLLAPVGARRCAWHVGYQDVVAIGRMLATGRPWTERTIALAGPGVRRPRLVRTRLGASTGDLVNGASDDMLEASHRVISGSVLSGRTATGWAAFLGRHHDQVTVLPDPCEGPPEHAWSMHDLFPRRRRPVLSTAQHGSVGPMLPLDVFDRVMPLDVLPTPLLRALLTGDSERAGALGALELEEEDLALCTVLCPGRNDYGPLLRVALDEIGRHA